MTYDIATRMERVGTRMKQLNDNSLVYSRADQNNVKTTATITNVTLGKFDVNEDNAFGITLITKKMLDFIFDTDELAGFDPAVPVAGDTIVFDGRTYETFSIGDQVYDFTTSTRTRIRIHAKQVA